MDSHREQGGGREGGMPIPMPSHTAAVRGRGERGAGDHRPLNPRAVKIRSAATSSARNFSILATWFRVRVDVGGLGTGLGVKTGQAGKREVTREVQRPDPSDPQTEREAEPTLAAGAEVGGGGRRRDPSSGVAQGVGKPDEVNRLTGGSPSLNAAHIVDVFLRHSKSFVHSFIHSWTQ